MIRFLPGAFRGEASASIDVYSPAPRSPGAALPEASLSWDSWMLRVLVLAGSAALSYRFALFSLHAARAAAAGFLIALLVLLAELRLRRAALSSLLGAVLGATLGLVVALLASLILSRSSLPELAKSSLELAALLVLGYLGLALGAQRGAELFACGIQSSPFRDRKLQATSAKLLDTSVLIDGRIAEISEAQFLDGVVVVPQFILHELQYVADSADPLKRQRGRRGLDVLERIKKSGSVEVRIVQDDFPNAAGVDHKLIELARKTGAKLVTNDFNLNKVATLQGLTVLNVNQLANALKPAVLPGEPMRVFVLREGKEANQGVAYLDDGTMVVVDGARRAIGRHVDIVVTSVHQTTAGKMIFGRLDDRLDQPSPARPAAGVAHSVAPASTARADAASASANNGSGRPDSASRPNAAPPAPRIVPNAAHLSIANPPPLMPRRIFPEPDAD